jgi:hypothetical protein
MASRPGVKRREFAWLHRLIPGQDQVSKTMSQITGLVFATVFAASCSEAISQPAEEDSTTVTSMKAKLLV